MPLYKRENEDDEEVTGELENNEVVVPSKTDQTWEKRYSDLRSYSAKQVNDLNKKLKDLEDKLIAKSAPLPKTEAEVTKWAQKYPDVYGLIKSIVALDLTQVSDTVNQKFKSLEDEKHEVAKERAMNAILAAHPDFFDLEKDENFVTWIGTKSKRVQDALYENDTDAQAAIEVVDLYKLETGATKKAAKKADPRDSARDVKVNSTRTPPNPASGDFDYSESQIDKMNDRDFEAHEDKIELARRNGRIFMDITGAAR